MRCVPWRAAGRRAAIVRPGATYWLATAASELFITPDYEAGSIGMFVAHQDCSNALKNEGVKTTLISVRAILSRRSRCARTRAAERLPRRFAGLRRAWEGPEGA
ncbi:hypothetical protein CUJ89_06845 [Burkholderia pyrrocinia]|uniref:Peptidase S49 domain-containing protein n=1 Tax=Burkholderia pyrrocinia TaxID=60550 RepID=A0A2Z5MUV1_BURPY|nr:hypothetical protein CUJ89_06845 [Burkholderia pyrrocinia]